MKKITVLFIAVLIVFSLSTQVFASPKAAVLIDAQSGRVLFEHNSDKKLPMASTTKIMTALLALEEENLDTYFTVNSTAIKVEGSSMGLKEGDRVTLRILAAGMLLASGNDAANAAAVKISGSVKAFVGRMNERAKELGMENTSFETPSGLDGENHFSTARDMAVLAREALKNPNFAAICSKTSMQLSYGDPPYDRWLSNHNKLLKTLEGATGVKTGFTEKSGRCLVSSAERNGVSLICVTLGCPDDWNYHKNIYKEYFGKLEAVKFEAVTKEIPLCADETKTVEIKSNPITIALLPEEKERVEAVFSLPKFTFLPAKKGKTVGKIIYYLDGEILAENPLFINEEIITERKTSFWDKIKDIS